MAKYKVILTSRAIIEIQNAILFYNLQQNGLGKHFYTDFKKQISSIKLHPFSRAVRYDDIRFAMLDKFPFAAHYNIENNRIIIQGVLSFYQNPETSWIEKKL